jgi:hypothetical protein
MKTPRDEITSGNLLSFPLLARSFRTARRSCWSASRGQAASGGRGALTFHNGRETVRGRHAICRAACDPLQKYTDGGYIRSKEMVGA